MLSVILDTLKLINRTDSSPSPLPQGVPASVRPCRTCAETAVSITHAQEYPNELVYARNGDSRQLGELLGKGGEGRVYLLGAHSDALVKLYHPNVLNGARSNATRAKLEAMIANPVMQKTSCFAWPRMLVFSKRGDWIGYAMRRVTGHQLQTLCQPLLIGERLPHWSRAEVITCALSFVDVIRSAHRQGIILGDINPANFLIDPHTCQVGAIDCDSYQVRGQDQTFMCPVGIPMLLAPELLARDYGRTERTPQQELFSVAIMLFRMFMLGLHPYSRTYGTDPVENLKSGACALGIGSGQRLPAGPWYSIWSHLPGYVKGTFIRAFREGHASPGERPTLDEWTENLRRYRSDMGKGWFVRTLIPQQPKSSKYRGRKSHSGWANSGMSSTPRNGNPDGYRPKR
jgi:DNA-binding helix-hairpin-helix protein with protein kinase domain